MTQRQYYVIITLAVIMIILTGCNNDEQLPVKDLKKQPEQVFIPRISDVFGRNIEVKCLFVDKQNNDGVVYAKEGNYRIEGISPEVGKVISIITNNSVFSFELSADTGTKINLTALNLSTSGSDLPININVIKHVCLNVSVSDHLFKIPPDIAFIDGTSKLLKQKK